MKTDINKLQSLCSNLFKVRDITHLAHLSCKGQSAYAKHIALNEYYNSLLDLIDGLVESCQGKYGIMDLTINETKTNNVDSVTMYTNLAKMLETDRNNIEEGWIQNQIDEVITLTYTLIYKLTNLK